MTDQAIGRLPNDTSLHEFRGVTLFALGRYADAAAPLYAVLAVGPGWDWPNFIALYPNVSVYTEQLRALEEYCRNNSGSASAHFVLSYLYLTQGHTDAALEQLKRIIALQPKDTTAAGLIQRLGGSGSTRAGCRPAPHAGVGPVRPGILHHVARDGGPL